MNVHSKVNSNHSFTEILCVKWKLLSSSNLFKVSSLWFMYWHEIVFIRTKFFEKHILMLLFQYLMLLDVKCDHLAQTYETNVNRYCLFLKFVKHLNRGLFL